MAQQPGGLGDPLQLAASGTLIPYFNAASGDLTFLEIAAPSTGIFNGHLVFFDATCQRGNSQNFPLTNNDVNIVDTRASAAGLNGLVAFASSSDNTHLVPLLGYVPVSGVATTLFSQNTGVHTKAFWLNATTGRTRVLEPIILSAAEYIANTSLQWSPLRTAATFWALPEGGAIASTLYLMCPRQTIQSTNDNAQLQAFPPQTDAVTGLPSNVGSVVQAFPRISPSFATGYPNGSITGRIYNLDEGFIQDFLLPCDCNQIRTFASISSGYTNFNLTPNNGSAGTYTEIAAVGPQLAGNADFGFTGYRATDVATASFFGLWERISNGSREAITSPDNTGAFVCTTCAPTGGPGLGRR
jgi:hypothetical protein